MLKFFCENCCKNGIFLRKLLQKRIFPRKLLQKRIFPRKLLQKRKISQKLSRKRKFLRKKISRKLAHFRFSRKWKNPFSFQPYFDPDVKQANFFNNKNNIRVWLQVPVFLFIEIIGKVKWKSTGNKLFELVHL
jgi:hypothetical protein